MEYISRSKIARYVFVFFILPYLDLYFYLEIKFFHFEWNCFQLSFLFSSRSL